MTFLTSAIEMKIDRRDMRSLIGIVSTATRGHLSRCYGIACMGKPHNGATAKKAPSGVQDSGGMVTLMVAISFDKALLTRLFQMETKGIALSDDQHDLYLRDTAAEIVNVILGNCLADLENAAHVGTVRKRGSISPPMVIEDVWARYKENRTAKSGASLQTEYGGLEIDVIDPIDKERAS